MSAAPSPDPARTLQLHLQRTARRWRLDLLARHLARALPVLALAATAWALLALVAPAATRSWEAGALLALGFAAFVAVEAMTRPTDWPAVRRGADRRLGLPDSITSADELRALPPSPWTERQLAQTVARLHGADWRQLWPLPARSVRRVAGATAVLAVALALIGHRANLLRAAARPAPPTAEARERAAALRELFNDWDQSERDAPDPELRQLLADLRPFREQLAREDQAPDARETFAALNRVEDRLAARRAALEAGSLAPVAAELAAAAEGVDGLGALAAALRAGDFARAEREAGRAGEQFAKTPTERMPDGPRATEAANRFGKLAEQMTQRGQPGDARAMQQTGQGLQQRDGKRAGQGMQGLRQSLGGQNAREGQARSLALQLRQMKESKDGTGDGQPLGAGLGRLPRLSLQRNEKPGKGASAETNLARTGAATSLGSERGRETVSGTAGETGESETTTLPALEPPAEQAAAGSAASFSRYEQMSRQAVADESLPLAHRESIRKYFERIRPGNGR